jgi:hypothetical protein
MRRRRRTKNKKRKIDYTHPALTADDKHKQKPEAPVTSNSC